jgi:cytochrome P450 family 6
VQGIIFMLAGFETTANTMGSMVFHLVKNPEVLETLVKELDETLETFQGRVDHETIADMAYLDACVKETLRSGQVRSGVIR